MYLYTKARIYLMRLLALYGSKYQLPLPEGPEFLAYDWHGYPLARAASYDEAFESGLAALSSTLDPHEAIQRICVAKTDVSDDEFHRLVNLALIATAVDGEPFDGGGPTIRSLDVRILWYESQAEPRAHSWAAILRHAREILERRLAPKFSGIPSTSKL